MDGAPEAAPRYAEGFDLTDAEVEAIGRLQRGNRTLKSYLPDPQDID